MSKSIINAAAKLRAERQFQEAIDAIEENISMFSNEDRTMALLEAFYAAREGGMISKAKEIAKQIAENDPSAAAAMSFLPLP